MDIADSEGEGRLWGANKAAKERVVKLTAEREAAAALESDKKAKAQAIVDEQNRQRSDYEQEVSAVELPKGKKQLVSIPVQKDFKPAGTIQEEMTVHGNWGIRKNTSGSEKSGYKYFVTHVPTGLSLGGDLKIGTLKEAQDLIRAVVHTGVDASKKVMTNEENKKLLESRNAYAVDRSSAPDWWLKSKQPTPAPRAAEMTAAVPRTKEQIQSALKSAGEAADRENIMAFGGRDNYISQIQARIEMAAKVQAKGWQERVDRYEKNIARAKELFPETTAAGETGGKVSIAKQSQEFDRLIMDSGPELGWPADYDVLHAGRPKGGDTASIEGSKRYQKVLTGLRRRAATEIGASTANLDTLAGRAALLDKLKTHIEEQKAKALPQLRPGEKSTADLFQGEDQPFNLTGEKAVDAERLAAEKAQRKADVKAEDEFQRSQPEFKGMGGAIPEEFEQPGNYVSNMFAAIDRDRAEMGKDPMPDTKHRGWDEDNQKALALMNRDPEWIPKLISEVAARPRPLLSWENAGLVWHRAKLKGEYNNSLSRIAQAFDDGRADDLQSARNEAAHFEDQLMALDAAVGRNGTGSEAGRSLNAQKMGAGDDFSLVEMRLQMRRANEGAPLTDKQNTEIAQLAKDHAEKLAAYQKIINERDARISELEATRAVNEIKADVKREPTYAPQIVAHAKRMVESLRVDRTSAMARLKARFGDKFTGLGGATPAEFEGPGGLKLTAQDVADLSMIGASEMAEFPNRAEWNARMSTALGKWVEPHLDAIWENSNKHLDAKIAQVEKRLGKPVGEKVARAVRKTDISERIADTKEKVQKKVSSGKSDGIAGDAQKLARLFVEQGITDRDALIDAVHDVLSEGNPDWTRRETMDAISGYGDFKQLTKDEISVTLRDLKGQMQQLGKLEDMAAGQAPSKTGIERRSPSDAERALIKLVNEAKKKGGFVVTDPATQLASALTARKTYYRNRLSDLRQEISTRERIVKTKSPTPTDAQLEAMKGEYAILKREHDEIFGNRALTDEQKLKMAMAAVKRDISEYERKISAGEFTEQPKPGITETPELKAVRAQRDALREQFNELRDLDEHFQREQHAKDLERQKTALEQSISDKEKRLAEGDITPRSQPVNRPADPILESLMQRRDALNKQLAEARKKPEEQRYAEQLARQLEAMNKRITEKEAKIAAGDISTAPKKINRPLPPDLEMAKQRLELLNKQLADLRNPPKTPEQRALQAMKTRMANRTAELEKRLADGDFAKRPRREGPPMDEEATTAKAALLRVEQRFFDAKRNAELKQRDRKSVV